MEENRIQNQERKRQLSMSLGANIWAARKGGHGGVRASVDVNVTCRDSFREMNPLISLNMEKGTVPRSSVQAKRSDYYSSTQLQDDLHSPNSPDGLRETTTLQSQRNSMATKT